MNNILSFDTASRGHSGRSRAHHHQTFSYDAAWRVQRLLDLLEQHIPCPHCLEELVVGIIERGDGLTGLELLARRVAGEARS